MPMLRRRPTMTFENMTSVRREFGATLIKPDEVDVRVDMDARRVRVNVNGTTLFDARHIRCMRVEQMTHEFVSLESMINGRTEKEEMELNAKRFQYLASGPKSLAEAIALKRLQELPRPRGADYAAVVDTAMAIQKAMLNARKVARAVSRP